jgi:hypothetical protein
MARARLMTRGKQARFPGFDEFGRVLTSFDDDFGVFLFRLESRR